MQHHKARSLKKVLDSTQGEPANFIVVGDLNSVGADISFYEPDVSSEDEIERLAGMYGHHTTKMRLLDKDSPETFWNGPGSADDPSDLDHVAAANHLTFEPTAAGQRSRGHQLGRFSGSGRMDSRSLRSRPLEVHRHRSIRPLNRTVFAVNIGVAVSGGGHRATAWAIGAVAALVDSGLNRDVVSVASVSGGSIANGTLACAETELSDYESVAHYADAVEPTLEVVANTGLFPNGEPTRAWVTRTLELSALAAFLVTSGVVAVVGVGLGDLHGLFRLCIAVLVAGIGAVLGWHLGATKLIATAGRSRERIEVFVALPLAVVVGAVVSVIATPWQWTVIGLMVAAAAWVIVVCGGRLARRGEIVRDALEQSLFRADQEAVSLGDLDRGVNHVFCATDLESGDHFYLTPKFLWGYREGITTDGPSVVSVAAAVQASAALPAAFPPVVLDTGPFDRDEDVTNPEEPPTRVVLSDGGVYDNMADQWELDFARRRNAYSAIADAQPPARLLVVANASADWEWEPFDESTRWPLRELLGLKRDQSIQYDVSTSRRRWSLIREFQATEAQLANPPDGTDPDDIEGLIGVIAMIDRSPLRLAQAFEGYDDKRGERATEAIEFLTGIRSADEWDALRRSNAEVPTTLDALGPGVTSDLLEHAYAMVNVGLYVIHGLGTLTPFPDDVFKL